MTLLEDVQYWIGLLAQKAAGMDFLGGPFCSLLPSIDNFSPNANSL